MVMFCVCFDRGDSMWCRFCVPRKPLSSTPQAKAEAKKRGTDNIKARLQFLVEDEQLAKQLSGPTRNGAINIHQRFDRHKPQVDSPLIWRAIKPPKRYPVYAPL